MTAMKLKKPALWSASEQRMQKSALLNKITQNKIISSVYINRSIYINTSIYINIYISI